MDLATIVHNYILIMPFIALTVYFIFFYSDPFFLKTRSSIQLLYALLMLGMVLISLLLWKCVFKDYTFLGYEGKSAAPFATTLAAMLAVFGWIFTARVQIVNAIKGHSMQVLMNSRNSTAYIEKVDTIMKLRREVVKENKDIGFNDADVILSVQKFDTLNDKDKSAILYMLNFLEFLAIGIRHYNLDEALLKQSMRSIVNSNYGFFHKIIELLREKDNPRVFIQFELLHSRWGKEDDIKCSKCRAWQNKVLIRKPWYLRYQVAVHIVATIGTCSTWWILIWSMNMLKNLQSSKDQEPHICYQCNKEDSKKNLGLAI